MRVLILSWEYPPIVEGGLARHVRKLSEALVAGGVEVGVLSDGALRDRLVAEAGEWVLRFDWADVARQTAGVYAGLRGARVS